MTHDEKLLWMTKWARDHDMTLTLTGQCGFGRECIGIEIEDHYPDYHWYEEDPKKGFAQLDQNGHVWTPPDAYHKHECVAVLGRGEKAEAQLYDWLKWFDDNGFVLEKGDNPKANYEALGPIAIVMGKHRYARMVRKEKTDEHKA